MRYKNFFLIGCASTGVLILSLAPSRQQARWLFEHSAFYFSLALVSVWLFRIWNLYSDDFKNLLKLHLSTLLLATAVTILIFVHSPPRFKILADESNLIGVSMLLHSDRLAAVPIEGIVSEYNAPDVITIPTKRPILFPFLVSVIHALIGYNPSNGLVLNFGVTLAALFFFAIIVSRLIHKSLEQSSILVLASAPIFCFYTTGSGFEALNMLFIILTFYMLVEVVESEGEFKRIELLFLTAILLSQCRYESAIVLILLAVFLVKPMIRWGSLQRLTTLGCLIPFFLLPIIWQRRIFLGAQEINRIDYGILQATSAPFSWRNFMANIDDNIFVLLGLDPSYGFTLPLSVAAIVGVYLLLRNIFRKQVPMGPLMALAIGMVSLLALLVIISAFHWGNFGLRMDNRLALVFLPFMALAALYSIHQLHPLQQSKARHFITAILLAHLVFFWPHGAHQHLINGLSLPFEYRRVVSYLKTDYPKNDQLLVIAELPNLYVIQPYSTIKLDRLNKAEPLIRKQQGQFDHIIALQKIDQRTGAVTPASSIPSQFELTLRHEMVITPEYSIRVSECRLTDVVN